MGQFMVEVLGRADAFLLGRGTYEIFAAHWPRVTDPAYGSFEVDEQPRFWD
jgi:hypothetical protein